MYLCFNDHSLRLSGNFLLNIVDSPQTSILINYSKLILEILDIVEL